MATTPQQIEQLIEPWIVRLVRKAATMALTFLVTWLIAKGVGIDPGKAAEWGIAIGTAVGVPLSYLLSYAGDKLIAWWTNRK